MIREESLGKIDDFLAAGGKVAFVGTLPCQNPRFGDDRDTTKRVQAILARHSDQVSHFADPTDLAALVSWIDDRASPSPAWDGPRAIRMLWRQEPEREILLLANPGKSAAHGRVSFPFEGLASRWNPETGTIQQLGVVAESQTIELEVPGESARFLVLDRESDE